MPCLFLVELGALMMVASTQVDAEEAAQRLAVRPLPAFG